jgi:multiple antibiotic resistance protein
MVMATISPVLIAQIFVLLNPLASFPFLINAHHKKMNLKKVAITSVLVAFAIAILITLTGHLLFKVFNITIDSLRIAGGIILLLLGINMVRPQERTAKEIEKVNSVIAIIATPLLTGPATISFITVKTYEIGRIPVLINLCFAFLIVGIVFYLTSILFDKINPAVIDILSRIMGLFLTAMAIEMISKGIAGMIRTFIL